VLTYGSAHANIMSSLCPVHLETYPRGDKMTSHKIKEGLAIPISAYKYFPGVEA